MSIKSTKIMKRKRYLQPIYSNKMQLLDSKRFYPLLQRTLFIKISNNGISPSKTINYVNKKQTIASEREAHRTTIKKKNSSITNKIIYKHWNILHISNNSNDTQTQPTDRF